MKAPDLYDLETAVAVGWVRSQTHPDADLVIWNYTEAAVYAGMWNDTTLQCRGLITTADGDIVARPFIKFFNYGEPACPVTDLVKVQGHVEITDKLDGSLGIIYRNPADGLLSVATRGSFTSEQAQHATRVLRTRYRRWAPPEGVTVLVEIVYPENRIVLDYGQMDDLVYLGAVRNDNGADYDDLLVEWPGPVRDQYELSFERLLREVNSPTMTNKEGFVLCWPRSDGPALRVKLKYREYVMLHKVVTGLSTKVVWEALLNDKYDDLVSVVPDEWKPLVISFADELKDRFLEIKVAAWRYKTFVEHESTRKAQALMIQSNENMKPYASLIFALLDGRDITNAIWRRIEPDYRPLTNNG